MDLCRRILLEVEANPEATGLGWIDLDIEGHDPTVVSYHFPLLKDAELLEATDLSDTGGLDWRPQRLTYALPSLRPMLCLEDENEN
jgi:hypothetical protein